MEGGFVPRFLFCLVWWRCYVSLILMSSLQMFVLSTFKSSTVSQLTSLNIGKHLLLLSLSKPAAEELIIKNLIWNNEILLFAEIAALKQRYNNEQCFCWIKLQLISGTIQERSQIGWFPSWFLAYMLKWSGLVPWLRWPGLADCRCLEHVCMFCRWHYS